MSSFVFYFCSWINFTKNEVSLKDLSDETKKIALNLLSQDFEKELKWLRYVTVYYILNLDLHIKKILQKCSVN